MSTNIESLDIQITASAGSAASKIDELANKLVALREASKLTTTINNLDKLRDALDKFDSVANLSSLTILTGALRSLSSIQKPEGLTSAVKELKKLPKIMGSIDDAALSEFAGQMERLASALAPVAKEIDTVAKGFAKLPSKLKSAVAATQSLGKAVDKAADSMDGLGDGINTGALNLSSFVTVAQAAMGVIHRIGDALTSVIGEALEWDGIQYRFGRAFGEDAEEVYAHAQRISDVMKINMQQFMQYSSLYGTLLKGFGLEQDKATTIAVGLSELSYDIWAAFNDRYKTLEDASEAVRSAITGEIEPIRNAGMALTEASLKDYLKYEEKIVANLENMTEAQKAEVRYAAMVEAAMNQGIVGTYAREMETAEGVTRTLAQQIKGLSQALGSIFLPVLTTVIPWITTFVSILYDVISAIAGFFNIPFFQIDWGNSTKDMSTGLSDVADEAKGADKALTGAGAAAKELKDFTMGFDELNIIDPTTASGGGGGGGAGLGNAFGGLDLETLWDDSVFAQASKQVDELKQKVLDWFEKWKVAIGIVSAAMATIGLAKMLSHLGEAWKLGEKFAGVMNNIVKIAASAIVITLEFAFVKSAFSSFMGAEGTFWDYIKGLLIGGLASWVLYSQWGAAGLTIGIGVMAVASLSAVIENGGITDVESLLVALTGMAAGIAAVVKAWPLMKPVITGIQEYVSAVKLMSTTEGWFAAMFPKISGYIAQTTTALSNASGAVSTFVGGLSTATLAGIVAAIVALTSAVYFLGVNWDDVKKAVKDFFAENIRPKLDEICKSWDEMVAALKEARDAILDAIPDEAIEAIEDFIDRVVEAFKSVDYLEGIAEAFEFLGGVIFGAVSGVIAGAFNTFMSVISGFVKVISGVVQIVSGVVTAIVKIFQGDLPGAWTAVKQIGSGIVDVFEGLWDMTVGAVIEFVDGVIEWFEELYDELVGHSIVPDMIDEIVDWFKELPSRAIAPVKNLVNDAVSKFKDMKQGALDKLEELKTGISDKWHDIKLWFNNNVSPVLKLSYWTNKLSEFVNIGKTVVENIKLGLSSAWTELKKWWSNLELPSFKIKTPHLSWSYNEATGLIAQILSGLGLPTKIPKLDVKWYANGGFPNMGDLFFMNEAGPEMLGSIGGRTAVVNNDQIVAAVSQGVYAAVVSAMGNTQNSGSQNVNVYLDGKQIYASVKKTERSRGVNLMGSQLGYAY